MYSPRIIDARERALIDRFGAAIGASSLRRRSREECWRLRDQLATAIDADGEKARDLTAEEAHFILHEQLLATIDYRYWSERWAVVAKETQDAEPLTPRWKSQDLFLARIARIEEERYQTHPDGILVNVLKARQLGISTETEAMLAHRLTTSKSVRGLVAGDVPEQSSYLLGMAELIVENLPWFLKPRAVAPTNKGSILSFQVEQATSSLRVAAGKSQRGGLQDQGGTKGNIGRGKTFGLVHISEVSTWERPEQLRDGLLPGVPRRPRTLCVFESTAKGRHDFWHEQWLATDKGITRFHNVFIPWYIEPEKYWLPVKDGWEPLPTTKEHAAQVERDSPKWLLGQTIRLTAEQLYWYELNRQQFDEDGRLYQFFEEYPATPEESFQHAGRSVFNAKTLERLKAQQQTPLMIAQIQPRKEIATLAAYERAQATLAARAAAAPSEGGR